MTLLTQTYLKKKNSRHYWATDQRKLKKNRIVHEVSETMILVKTAYVSITRRAGRPFHKHCCFAISLWFFAKHIYRIRAAKLSSTTRDNEESSPSDVPPIYVSK